MTKAEALVRMVERKCAILALDERWLRDLCVRDKIKMPSTRTGFLAGMHKARALMTDATQQQRHESLSWLAAHGSGPYQDPRKGEA